MNINDLTLGQIKTLTEMFGGASQQPSSPHVGKKCIIRTYASGVHYGTLDAQHGRQVELSQSRRLWRFDAAPHGISLSEVAMHGGTGGRHRYCETVPSITILDALEIIPCSDTAIAAIEAAPVSQPS